MTPAPAPSAPSPRSGRPRGSASPGPGPSDVLLAILAGLTLLATCFVAGGLMAHPFAG